jgi:SOS-response transcriptional repressor LexA
MKKLTKVSKRQKELLDFITSYQNTNNTLPTLLLMAEAMKITVGGVHQKIGALMRKKILKRSDLYIITLPEK